VQLHGAFRRYTKFLVVGTSNAVVDVGVLNGCLLIGPSKSPFTLLIYNSIAVLCAIVNSYFWNRHWTFGDVATNTFKERWLFGLQALINIAFNNIALVWASTYLIFSKSIPVIVSSNVSKGLAMLISSSISFFFMRFLVFRR